MVFWRPLPPEWIELMKLGLVYRSVVEKKDDGYYIKDVMGTYLEKIAPLFSRIDLCAPICPPYAPEKSFSHCKLRLPNVRLCHLGVPKSESSIPGKLAYYARLIKLFSARVPRWDVLYVFLPGYAGVIASVIARVLGKPYFAYIGTDWRLSSHYVWRWQGIKKELLFPLYVNLNGYCEKMVIRHSAFSLVHGDALQKKYKHCGAKIHQTAPLISLSTEDIHRKKPRVHSGAVKCLFVGALNPIKGLPYVIEAVSLLRERGYDIALDIVGAGNQNYKRNLIALANQLNLNGHVTFRGYVPNGPRLLELYRGADLFVLPTLGEGFPRVLYEAMAQSLPIVTTNVGGIPGLMTHEVNALVIPPKNPEALARAIERLIASKRLREVLAQNGIETVRAVLKKDTARQLESLLVRFIPEYGKNMRKVEAEVETEAKDKTDQPDQRG
jgi:glycosyltransferase involved in cell wall biosynthesis